MLARLSYLVYQLSNFVKNQSSITYRFTKYKFSQAPHNYNQITITAQSGTNTNILSYEYLTDLDHLMTGQKAPLQCGPAYEHIRRKLNFHSFALKLLSYSSFFRHYNSKTCTNQFMSKFYPISIFQIFKYNVSNYYIHPTPTSCLRLSSQASVECVKLSNEILFPFFVIEIITFFHFL